MYQVRLSGSGLKVQSFFFDQTGRSRPAAALVWNIYLDRIYPPNWRRTFSRI